MCTYSCLLNLSTGAGPLFSWQLRHHDAAPTIT
jgi:hypothetical protein